ncbi:MAG: LytTR family transcriptional regulator [Bacteroidales bacterium]|nr:LytTR family transcriptional regulator [Bacteroidales bacterium]
MGKKLPRFLLGKYQIIGTVTFTAFFSLVFLLISVPFSHNFWFNLGASQAFGFTAAFFSISLLVIIFSRKIMYDTRNLFVMTYLQFIAWSLMECLGICLLYTFFSVQGDRMGIISVGGLAPSRIFGSSLVYIFASLVVPYVIAAMYFALVDKNNTIRMLNYSNVVSDEEIDPKDQSKFTLFDNNGSMKFSVSSNNLYYIESDDNYIKAWYLDSKGELKTYMVRCRLKTVEESFLGTSLVRCHRKYVVNMDKVNVLRKETDGYILELDNDAIEPIPVTKTYVEQVLSRVDALTIKRN